MRPRIPQVGEVELMGGGEEGFSFVGRQEKLTFFFFFKIGPTVQWPLCEVLACSPLNFTIILWGRPSIGPKSQLRKVGSETCSDWPKATQLPSGIHELKAVGSKAGAFSAPSIGIQGQKHCFHW